MYTHVCLYIHVEARGQYWVSFSICSFTLFYFVTDFHCIALAAWNSRIGWPRTHRDPLASHSQLLMLRLKMCATLSGSSLFFEAESLRGSDFTRMPSNPEGSPCVCISQSKDHSHKSHTWLFRSLCLCGKHFIE